MSTQPSAPAPTPTPRTDENVLLFCSKVTGGQIVLADFARQLERELNAAKQPVPVVAGDGPSDSEMLQWFARGGQIAEQHDGSWMAWTWGANGTFHAKTFRQAISAAMAHAGE